MTDSMGHSESAAVTHKIRHMASTKSLLILLKNVEDLDLVTLVIQNCKGRVLSVLSHCRDIVLMSTEGHKLIPNLFYLSTLVTRFFGSSCLQYQYFLMTLLSDIKKLSFDLLSQAFSTDLGALSLLQLLVSNYSFYSQILSLQLLSKSCSKCEQLSFAHYCLELAKIFSLGGCEVDKNAWLSRIFGNELLVDYEVKWAGFIHRSSNSLKSRSHSHENKLNSEKGSDLSELVEILPGLETHEHIKVVAGFEFYHRQQNSFDCGDRLANECFIECKERAPVLAEIASAMSCYFPLMLCGPSSSGKSSFVEHMADKIGLNEDQLVRVQITSQFEDRILTGFYTCGDNMGELLWRKGILQSCYETGKWLLLEDIHKASPDVITVIQHFLANSRGEKFLGEDFVPGFQLIATCEPDYSGNLLSALKPLCSNSSDFKVCFVPAFTDEELCNIIVGRYPKISEVITKLLILKSFLSKANKKFSLHNFFKYCSVLSVEEKLDAQMVCHSALDFFTAMLPDQEVKLSIAEEIVATFNFSKENALYFIQEYKPDVKIDETSLKIGRSERIKSRLSDRGQNANYALTKPALIIVENVILSVQHQFPVLLCGETGTGKTSCVQFVAQQFGTELTVLNMSHQSTAADLIGGFKPVSLALYLRPIKIEFENLFKQSFNMQKNQKFFSHVNSAFLNEKFSLYLRLVCHVCETVPREHAKIKLWKAFDEKFRAIVNALNKREKSGSSLMFAFVEGCLLQAMKNGTWLLLDEINLACPETLDCLLDVLANRRVFVDERGDKKPVIAHESFRLFACMNPATDVGKTELPTCVRNHFREFYFPQTHDKSDLSILVNHCLKKDVKFCEENSDKIVTLYNNLQTKAKDGFLFDSEDKRANISLRSLARALKFISKTRNCSAKKACAEAFMFAVATGMNQESREVIVNEINTCFPNFAKDIWSKHSNTCVNIQGVWLEPIGNTQCSVDETYILTATVNNHLKQIASIIMAGRDPVLLQGETSVGKTSLIHYLAKILGQNVWRINNHEHTDIQEYLGAYCTSKTGELVFEDGILIKAMKNGHWVILDELNLAPTEVLEALNRLLDDNREIYIPETNKLVKAHPQFMLFGTQNPAGSYSGRKVLSRAFRDRFIQISFDQIPENELQVILSKRCELPKSYASKIIQVMKHLHSQRCFANLFAGRSSFITLRDLFRWANRYTNLQLKSDQVFFDWNLYLAEQGFMLLGGRARNDTDLQIIKQGIETCFKVNLSEETLFDFWGNEADRITDQSLAAKYLCKLREMEAADNEVLKIAWTTKMMRLAFLVSNALENREPVLLIGETGCGKTTLCQLLAAAVGQVLFTVNCNMNSDASDFIGSLLPVRNRSSDATNVNSSSEAELETFQSQAAHLFEWQDGPVVLAAKTGGLLLLDEISLADDSVLERLNSLFEQERTLLLAENTQNDVIDEVKVHKDFRVVATMNPSGDYGKKELSIALRNRFTEIWCPSDINKQDIKEVVEKCVDGKSGSDEKIKGWICEFILKFLKDLKVTLRDVKSWIEFIYSDTHQLEIERAYIEGAWLVFLDCIEPNNLELKNRGASFLNEQTGVTAFSAEEILIPKIEINSVSVAGFSFPRNSGLAETKERFDEKKQHFDFNVPTTNENMVKIMRGLAIRKPILIEGEPGIGKTALVENIAALFGYKLVRINLSEQTDINDLLGNDLPNVTFEDFDIDEEQVKEKPTFCWHDGPLLSALTAGHWVLLDEINLASQSVLEGLNAVFDHRGEVFISELNRTFYLKSNSTRFFATQNPAETTHGRKCLPRSFLNRFSKIYMDCLKDADYTQIFTKLLPDSTEQLRTQLLNLISWNEELNLRDVLRFAKCVESFKERCESSGSFNIESAINFIVEPKIQLKNDATDIVLKTVSRHSLLPVLYSREDSVNCGKFGLQKKSSEPSSFFCFRTHFNPETLESIIGCVSNKFPVLITGSSGHKKVEVVQQLGASVGHEVHSMNLNSCTDVLDLFGKYTNFDSQLLLKSCIESISKKLKTVLRNEKTPRELVDKLFLSLICLQTCTTFESLSNFKLLLKNMNRFSNLEIKNMLQEIDQCMKNAEKNRKFNNFVWENSVLINSLRNGHWLVLQNVDMCSPAILDRLNSLLEQNGELLLGELSTNEDGEVLSIKPHSDFRIFLTTSKTSQKSAVVSSAMYNRCVVVRLDDTESPEIETDTDDAKIEEKEVKDFELYCQKLHSWFQASDGLVRLFEQEENPDEINVFVCALEHQINDSGNEWVQICSLRYLQEQVPAWMVSLEKSFSNQFLDSLLTVQPDSSWNNLPFFEESSTRNVEALKAANTIVKKLIEVMNFKLSSTSVVLKVESTHENLTTIGSYVEKNLKVKKNNDVYDEFRLMQKVFKWFYYSYLETFKTNDCGLDKLLPFISHKLETLLDASCSAEKFKFKFLTKAFNISITEALSEKLTNLFKDEPNMEFEAEDGDIEEMEISESSKMDTESSLIPQKTPQLEPDFWIELAASISVKNRLLCLIFDEKPVNKNAAAGCVPSIALQSALDLITYVNDSHTEFDLKDSFESKFVSFMSWARLWSRETEMIESRMSLEKKYSKLISVPTLETFSQNFGKVTALYSLLWENSGSLLFQEEGMEKAGQFVKYVSEKANLRNQDGMSLSQTGLYLFEKCTASFSLFDPAEELIHKLISQSLYLEVSQKYLDMKVRLYGILTGYSEGKLLPYLQRHPKVKLLQKILEKSKTKVEKYQINPYQREPNTAKYRQVVETVASFYSSVLEHSLSNSFGISKVSWEQLTAVETSALSFIKVMLQDYPEYIDVLYLPFTALCLILMEIEQQKLLRKQNRKAANELSVTSLISKEFAAESWEPFLNATLFEENVEHVFSLCQLFPHSWKSVSSSLLRPNKKFVSKLFSRMYKLWRVSEQRELDRQIEQEKGYVYKDKTKIGHFDTDSIIPDEPKDSDEVSTDEIFEKLEATSKEPSEFTFSAEHYFQIWKAQDAITRAMLEGESSCLTEFDSDLLRLLNKWTKSDILLFNYDQTWLKSFIIEVNSHRVKYYSTENATKSNNIYNIYTDSNVPEFSKCGPLLKDLKRRVSELLAEWPEHPTLCQIMKSADRMLYSFPVDKPVVFMSVALESLLALCNSWETVAAKYVSLQQRIGPLKQLLIHWRSLELTFWKQSMQYHQRQVYMSVARFWFNLFSLFVQTFNEQITVKQLSKALSKFLQTSKVGEFQARLDILKSWANYCKLFNKTHLYSTVLNLVAYYSAVLERITKHQENQVSLLRQELKSFIKIQQWRDFNIFSLKESVRRCKVKIRKVLNDYAKLLDEPVKDHLILRKETSDTIHKISKTKSASSLLEGVNILGSFSPSNENVSDKFSTIHRASEKFTTKLASLKKALQCLNDLYENLETDNESVKNQLSECHKESRELEQKISNSKDEEDKKKLLSTAKFQMQKRRGLFKELVEYLTSLSFSYKRSLNSNIEVTSLFEEIPSHLIDRFSPILMKCREKSLYLIHQYAAFSNIASSPNSELDPQIAQVCTGFVNDMVSEMFSFWKQIHGILSFICDTEVTAKEMKTFHGQNSSEYSFIISRLHPKCSNFLRSLISTAEECTQFLWFMEPPGVKESAFPEKQNGIGFELGFSIADNKLTETNRVSQVVLKFLKSPLIKAILKNCNEIREKISLADSTDEVNSLVTEILGTLDSFLQNDNENNPFLCTLKASFENLLSECRSLKAEITSNANARPIDLHAGENEMYKFCISAVNKAQKLRDDLPNMAENFDGFSFHRLKNAVEGAQETIDMHKKISHLKKFKNAVMKPINQNPDNLFMLSSTTLGSLHLTSASSCFLTDSLRLLVNEYAKIFSGFLDLTQTCNQLFLDLITHGFCVPKQLKESMASGLEKQTGGFEEAGIDEGTGTNDVSDKIESEDQLKLEQKKSNEEREDDQKQDRGKDEDEKQPIDMSEDFDGHLEDIQINDESDNDSDDNDANGDDENIDDKFGGDGENDGNQDDQQQEEINDEFWGDEQESDQEENEQEKQEKKDSDDKNKKGVEANNEKSNDAEDAGDNDENLDSNEMSKDGVDNEKAEGKMTASNEDESKPDEEEEDESDEKNGEKGDSKAEEKRDDSKTEELNKGEEKELDEAMEKEMALGDEDESDENTSNEHENFPKEELTDNNEVEKSHPESENEEGDVRPEETSGTANDDENEENDLEKKDDQKDGTDEVGKSEQNTPDEGEENTEDNAASTVLESLPTDQANAETDDHCGGAAPQNEQNSSGINQNSAPQNLDSSQPENNESGAKSSYDVFSYGDDKQGGKRNLPEEERQIGTEDEPVEKKGKIEDSDKMETGKPPENLPKDKDVTYQHVKENQKYDVQMFDDSKELENMENVYKAVDENEENIDNDETPKDEKATINDSDDESIGNEDDLKVIVSQLKDVQRLANEIEESTENEDFENDVMETEEGQEKVFASEAVAPSENLIKPFHDDLDELKSTLEDICSQWSDTKLDIASTAGSNELWRKYESLTFNLSRQLAEQIKMILEPLQSGRLQGDYRSGKRLNMKKLIPYIASGYRKDKIWLRRTKPQKRNYQVMIAIDDSESMADGKTRSAAFESIATLTTALALVEVGQIAVAKFGEECHLIHKFDEPFTVSSGAKILQHFNFDQPKTKIADLMKLSTEYMLMNKNLPGQITQEQLLIIISDGRGLFVEGCSKVSRAVEASLNAGVWTIFIVLDTKSTSIADILLPVFTTPTRQSENETTPNSKKKKTGIKTGGAKLEMKSYLDVFPFQHYILLGESDKLTSVICAALQQWIQLLYSHD